MTTTPTPAGGQAPPEGDTSGQEPITTPTSGQEPKSQQDLEKIIADLRRENAANRVKAKEFEDLQKKLETDKLSDMEKLQKQVTDLQKQYDAALAETQSLKRNADITRAADKLG